VAHAVSAIQSLTSFLFGWAARRPAPAKAFLETREAPSEGAVVSSKALKRFLTSLSHREGPVLLDLGPVVGSNVAFFGEQLGCKIFVENLYQDLDQFAREDRCDELPAFLTKRLEQPDGGVDGVLCWDVFDYLDKPCAQALAQELIRVLRPGGVLLGLFGTTKTDTRAYNKFVVVDDHSVHQKPYPALRGRQSVLLNRDIDKLFPGLSVSESFLLLNKTREILFRKRTEEVAQRAMGAVSSINGRVASKPRAAHSRTGVMAVKPRPKAARNGANGLNGPMDGAMMTAPLNGSRKGARNGSLNATAPAPARARRAKHSPGADAFSPDA
jgi:Methyltransferase domain